MLFSGLTWLSHSLCRPEYLLLLQTFVSKPHIGKSDHYLDSPQCRCHHNQGNYHPSSMFELGLEMAEAGGANPPALVASSVSRKWVDIANLFPRIHGESFPTIRKAHSYLSDNRASSKPTPPYSVLDSSQAQATCNQSQGVSLESLVRSY